MVNIWLLEDFFSSVVSYGLWIKCILSSILDGDWIIGSLLYWCSVIFCLKKSALLCWDLRIISEIISTLVIAWKPFFKFFNTWISSFIFKHWHFLTWIQFSKENPRDVVLPQVQVKETEDVKEEMVTKTLRRAISFYSTIQAHDGHWPGDYGGPMFLLPGLVSANLTTSASFVVEDILMTS